VTVSDWIDDRSHQVPRALAERMRGMLGSDAKADVSRTATVCLAAAHGALAAMLSQERFERSAALDLLAIDALMTFGFEHAGSVSTPDAIAALAKNGSTSIGQLIANV
jgi:hypothetical protein